MESSSADNSADRTAADRNAAAPATPAPSMRGRVVRRLGLVGLLIISCAALAIGGDWYMAVPKDRVPEYVGRQTCAQCHQGEVHAWTGSHHDLAMDLATDATVLADFNDAMHTYEGVTTKMFRRDDKFFVNTEGADGKFADFEVKYVIGVEPLQQYMVEFPDGRVQVLRETWDTAGKRWFYAYPPDVKNERLAPDDPLHWTGRMSNWNFMCADCHTTNLKKNFDVASDSYHTTFSENDVSCETCHGPGSIHVELANSKSLFWDRNHGYGLARLKGESSKNEIQSCAKCHMRRSRQLTDDYRPGGELANHFAAALLHERLYHVDGQINDEVYVYGSFLQSKMHAKGIRCTDCHNPHTTKLKHEGNQLCTSCHQHPAQKYDTPAHHHHKAGSTGAKCVECHMPEKHYMVVDPRRDHSLRVPRPDLSVKLGTPNACTDCHLEMELEKEGGDVERPYYADWHAEAQRNPGDARSRVERLDRWAAEQTTKWYGEKKERREHFAHAFAAARAGDPKGEDKLIEVLRRETESDIVRSSALFELGYRGYPSGPSAAFDALEDKSSLVRAAALNVFLDAPLESRTDRASTPVDRVAPLLNDPVRYVRIEAARVLVPYVRFLTSEEQIDFDKAAAEVKAANQVAGETAEAHRELALFHEQLGQHDSADAEFDTALRLAHSQAESSSLHYRRAMVLLGRKKPDGSRHLDAAIEELHTALKEEPENRIAMHALLTIHLEMQQFEKAVAIVKAWHERFPDDPEVPAIVRQIEFLRQRAHQQQQQRQRPTPLQQQPPYRPATPR